jgi:Phosphotransferase enzyme family
MTDVQGSGRDQLGAADVTDAQLTAMVADLLRQDDVELLDVAVATVDYELPSITTGGRWWVSGHAATPCSKAPFRLFVKQVQSWERSPLFGFVPEEFREMAVAGVPWKTEAEVYRSDLADRLPDGLTAPRALGVFDLDATSSAIWLEEVPARPATWDRRRYERAAYLLGRLSGSRALAPLATLRDLEWSLDTYRQGRLAMQVIPLLMSDEVWQHPLCTAFDDDLRRRLRAAAADVDALVTEGDALPSLLSHGDACPNNLLASERDDDLVMIDFGFWGPAPVGFDLTQLLVGDVQIGKRRVDGLAELDDAIVAAYVAGLRAEGCDLPEAVVWRGHALCMLIMTGLSALPFDLFEGPVDERSMQLAAGRAELARHALEVYERTTGQRS